MAAGGSRGHRTGRKAAGRKHASNEHLSEQHAVPTFPLSPPPPPRMCPAEASNAAGRPNSVSNRAGCFEQTSGRRQGVRILLCPAANLSWLTPAHRQRRAVTTNPSPLIASNALMLRSRSRPALASRDQHPRCARLPPSARPRWWVRLLRTCVYDLLCRHAEREMVLIVEHHLFSSIWEVWQPMGALPPAKNHEQTQGRRWCRGLREHHRRPCPPALPACPGPRRVERGADRGTAWPRLCWSC